jgi:hypothetical protein
MRHRSSVRLAVVSIAVGASVLLACRNAERASPTSPTSTEAPSSAAPTLSFAASGAPRSGKMDHVTFPPNNEPYDFRLRLERHYQNVRRAVPSPTYVDLEGGGVWIAEYIRYRVYRCAHNVAVNNVMIEIDTLRGTIPGTCGEPPTGTVEFPPRNEPADFRRQLELKYRDGLRRNPIQSYVDLEGDIVWMQQYYLYRLNACDHLQASDRTLVNIETSQTQPFCQDDRPIVNVQIAAVIEGPTGAVNTNRDVTFSGLRSSSSVGNITRYEWNCGAANVTNCTSTSPTPTFRYPKNGPLGTTARYNVTLVVTDSQGNRSNVATHVLTVTQAY